MHSDHHHHHDHQAPRTEHVVLELGDGIGALVVHTGPELIGVEVEISPDGEEQHRSHKQVLERVTAGGPAHVLVFDYVAEGSYTLWLEGAARTTGVRVESGAVAELDWRAGAPGA
jgi:hypothetical protein